MAIDLDSDRYIKVPEVNLAVSKELTLLNHNREQINQFLAYEGEVMPNPIEYVAFLKEAQKNHPALYQAIVERKDTMQGEFLDAQLYWDRKQKGHTTSASKQDMTLTYHVFDAMGKRKPRTEELSRRATNNFNLLTTIEDWLNNTTRQGLPNNSIKSLENIDDTTLNFEVTRGLPNPNYSMLHFISGPTTNSLLFGKYGNDYKNPHWGVRAAKRLTD